MFFLVLRTAGVITQLIGPMSHDECEARKAVAVIDLPANQVMRCQVGRIDVDMTKDRMVRH